MVRVLFYTGTAMLTVSASLLYLPTYFSVYIAILLFAILVLLFILHKKIRINGLKFLVCTLLLFTLLGVYTKNFYIAPAKGLENYNAEIIGTVSEQPERYSNYSVYIIKTEKVTIKLQKGEIPPKEIPQELKLRLSDVNEIGAEVFDKLKLDIRFNPLDTYEKSSFADKIYAGGYITELKETLGKNRPFYAVFYDLREDINNLIFDNINYKDASVVSAVLLGDRNNLDGDFSRNSKRAGITHMLVVSGMHLGILYQLLMKVMSALKMRRRLSRLIILTAIFAMEAICGFTPSILRAGLTYTVLTVGEIIFRKPDALNSLGFSAMILLFINPLGFGNFSLLLSLLATFGLLYICPVLEEIFIHFISKIYLPGRCTKAIVFALSQSISASLATMPVSILGIGYISVVAPITNLLTGFAAGMLTYMAFISVVLLFLPSVFKAAATFPLTLLCLLVRYLVKITELCASLDFATIPAKPEYLISLGIFLIIIPLVFLIKKINKKKWVRISLKITASLLVLASVSSFLHFYTNSPKCQIAVLDVGKGNSIVVKDQHYVTVIGAGDKPDDYGKIESHLLRSSINGIDFILLPAANKTFAGGCPEMAINNYNARVIYPKNGDYTEKLDYISTDNFKTFKRQIGFTYGNTEIKTLANIGTVINIENLSVVIYLGGDINKLTKLCKNKNPIFITSDIPAEQLPKGLSNRIFKNENNDLCFKIKDNSSYEISKSANNIIINF